MQFTEKLIEGGTIYEQLELPSFPVGHGITFFLHDFENRNSEQFGDFLVAVGLKLDINAQNMVEFVNSGNLASFIPNTQLRNLVDSGMLKGGSVYRITKKWERGDKFQNGKVAKGFGYEVAKFDIAPSDIDALFKRFESLKLADLNSQALGVGQPVGASQNVQNNPAAMQATQSSNTNGAAFKPRL